MRLGSIVGLILAGILTVSGIVLCLIGSSSAKSENRNLLMQIDDNGTHYVQDVSSDITKISLKCENAKIVINGGADSSFIEFTNFNPNRYSISATANVITFSESADISSLLDLGDIGFSFKGLRYFLDPRNDDFDDLEKTIVVNLSSDSSIKILDIDASNADLSAENLNVSGDILLDIKTGSITLNGGGANSSVSITGDELKTCLTSYSSNNFKYSCKSGELLIDKCNYKNSDVLTESGRVDFISEITLDDKHISVSTETGSILFNTKPITSPFNHEPPAGGNADEKKDNFKIVGKTTSISLQFPSDIVLNPATPNGASPTTP